MTQEKTEQKTVQKTAHGVVYSVVHKISIPPRVAGKWFWHHRAHIVHGAMITVVVVGMVSGANRLVFGRVFPLK